jgi:hypothetical protein
VRKGCGSIDLNVNVRRAGASSDVPINLTSPALFQALGLRARRQLSAIIPQTRKDGRNEYARNSIEGETCILLRLTYLNAGGYSPYISRAKRSRRCTRHNQTEPEKLKEDKNEQSQEHQNVPVSDNSQLDAQRTAGHRFSESGSG